MLDRLRCNSQCRSRCRVNIPALSDKVTLGSTFAGPSDPSTSPVVTRCECDGEPEANEVRDAMHRQRGDGDFSPEIAPDVVLSDAKVAGYVGIGDVVLMLLVANL